MKLFRYTHKNTERNTAVPLQLVMWAARRTTEPKKLPLEQGAVPDFVPRVWPRDWLCEMQAKLTSRIC